MDFSIRPIESGPVRGPAAPKRRKERAAPEFSVGGEGEGQPERADSEPCGAGSDCEDETPISPVLDDEAGGRLDVTA